MSPTLGAPRDAGAIPRRSRLDALIDGVVDYRAIVPLRIAAGLLLFAQLAPAMAASLDGVTYRDTFHIPVVAWFPELPEPLFVAALWLAALAAVMLAAGLFTKAAASVAASFAVYHLLLTETHYHHNRAFLAVLLVFLALVPAGEQGSLDAWLGRVRSARPGHGVRWPLTLVRFQIGAVYAASGISKLLDPDWFGGTVLQLRVAAQRDAAIARGIPQDLVELASSLEFQQLFSKGVVLTEIFIGLGLWWPKTRWAAVWVAIAFHIAIEATAEVELFSYAAVAALVIWIVPSSRDRTLVAPEPWARAVSLLDWTGRFLVVPGSGWQLDSRSGGAVSGRDAQLRAATLLPATFFAVAPLAAWRGLKLRRLE